MGIPTFGKFRGHKPDRMNSCSSYCFMTSFVYMVKQMDEAVCETKAVK